jgi:MOSC domain-containing protein YiiM
MDLTAPHVVAVAVAPSHGFSKQGAPSIDLLPGLGVAGDAHAGETVRHRSRVAVDPSQPNLRQVHLIATELLDELTAAGFDLSPGDLGENVTTRGMDLLTLPQGTRLSFSSGAAVTVTGLRNPCAQIEAFRPGLLARVLVRSDAGLVRRAGIMAVVADGGPIRPGDAIAVQRPEGPHLPLERV